MLRGDFAGFQGLSLWWIWSCKAEELAEALEYEYCSRFSFPTACVCQEELWPTGKASWTPGEGGMVILGKPAVKKETNCITSRFLAYQRSSAPDFWGEQRLCQQHLPYEGWAWGHAVIACSPQQIITSLPTSSCAWRSYIILKRNISCYPAAREKEGGPECSQLGGRAAVPQHPSGSHFSAFNLASSDSDSNLFSLSRTMCLLFSSTWKKSGHCSQAEMPPQRGKGWGCICPTTRYFSSKPGLDLLQLSISSKLLLHFSPLCKPHSSNLLLSSGW